MEVEEFAENDDLEAFLKKAEEKGVLVVVDFHAQWCGPCKMIAPKIVTMAVEMEEYCWFCKVDVDEAEEITNLYNIQVMPTFLFFKKSEKVGELTGASETKLREKINQLRS